MSELVADVVVVGGGAAGLSAAIAAATAGASVLVLEKNPMLGGSSRLSVGSINAAGSSLQKRAGIIDTPDEHFEDMDWFTGAFAGRDNLALRRILVDNAADSLEWLISLGMSFYGPTADPPHRHARMHNILPNSRAYPYCLGREARRLGVDIRLNTPVLKVLGDGQEGARGALASMDGSPTEVRARLGVILAAGDYSNGMELKQLFRPELVNIPAVNPTATGDGQRMGEAFGGHIVNGEVVYGPSLRFCELSRRTLVSRLPPSRLLGKMLQMALQHLPIGLFRPFVMSFMTASLGPELSLLRCGAILVNAQGQRFADEMLHPGLAIAKQSGQRAWLVFDSAVAKKFSGPPHHISTAPGVAFAYLADYKRHRKDLYHCEPTLDDLARSSGLPAEQLRAATAAHNAVLQAVPSADRSPVVQPPYYLLGPLESRIVITDGGLAVDTRHQVLRPNGTPIPRLFAAGATGQGGALLAGNGHHICWAVTSGRRAGRFAAQEAQSSQAPVEGDRFRAPV